MGLNKAAVKGLERSNRRNAYLIVALAIFLVIIPLGTTTSQVFQQRQMEKQTVQLAYQWVANKDYSIRRIQVVEDQVILEIYGSGERPRISELGEQLSASLDQPVELSLFIVPSEREDYIPSLE